MFFQFFEWIRGSKEFSMLLIVLGGALLCALCIGGVCKSTGLFAALAWSGIGGGYLYGIFRGVMGRQLGVALALAAICAGILYALLFCRLAMGRAIALRKKRRLEAAKRVRYTLPDKDNAYLRARLNTVLRVEEGETPVVERTDTGVRLEYARKMLAEVRGATLSPIERLDVEEMSALVATYAQKEKWSGADMKALNEVLARLLKLSAKYEIAV